MQLEVGKCYFDRTGARHGPLSICEHEKYPYESLGESWTRDGRYLLVMEHEFDLIAEAPAPLQPVDGLPVWRCHKEVWAARITGWGEGFLSGDDETLILEVGSDVQVSKALKARLPDGQAKNAVGGYYVRYADGYESWSPAKAFEEGYSRRD